jgi:hypothetical protein
MVVNMFRVPVFAALILAALAVGSISGAAFAMSGGSSADHGKPTDVGPTDDQGQSATATDSGQGQDRSDAAGDNGQGQGVTAGVHGQSSDGGEHGQGQDRRDAAGANGQGDGNGVDGQANTNDNDDDDDDDDDDGKGPGENPGRGQGVNINSSGGPGDNGNGHGWGRGGVGRAFGQSVSSSNASTEGFGPSADEKPSRAGGIRAWLDSQ